MATDVQEKYLELVGKLRENLKKSYEESNNHLDNGDYSAAIGTLEKAKEIASALAAVCEAAEVIGM